MMNPLSISNPTLFNGNFQSKDAVNKTSPATALNQFSQYLGDALEAVNRQQVEAEQMTEKLATGEVKDLHQVLIATQAANLSLALTVQVRNKVIEAYQEIMRMPL